jgi:hypothetical protein
MVWKKGPKILRIIWGEDDDNDDEGDDGTDSNIM